MIEAQTSDMMICQSSEGMPHSAWQLTALAVKLPSRPQHSSCGSTNHHVPGMSPDHLIMYFPGEFSQLPGNVYNVQHITSVLHHDALQT